VLRLLRRELAAAKDMAAALLEEESAVVNLVPQDRHAPSGPQVRFEDANVSQAGGQHCATA
jgi:hypothetical protein